MFIISVLILCGKNKTPPCQKAAEWRSAVFFYELYNEI